MARRRARRRRGLVMVVVLSRAADRGVRGRGGFVDE
jgi:hypothetical protein